MATSNQNLSNYNDLPNAGTKHFGIVVSEWNSFITDKLLEGAIQTLKEAGAKENQIHVHYVPGSFELPLAAQKLFEEGLDAVLCLGCVIQGETPHFDFVCEATAIGIMQTGLKYNKPCIFGVITTLNNEQAEDRAGGKHGNKGIEAAVTALKMLK